MSIRNEELEKQLINPVADNSFVTHRLSHNGATTQRISVQYNRRTSIANGKVNNPNQCTLKGIGKLSKKIEIRDPHLFDVQRDAEVLDAVLLRQRVEHLAVIRKRR